MMRRCSSCWPLAVNGGTLTSRNSLMLLPSLYRDSRTPAETTNTTHDEALRAERNVPSADKQQGQGHLRALAQPYRFAQGFLGRGMKDDHGRPLLAVFEVERQQQVGPDAV